MVKREGFDHLTMKALAQELDVTPMAIYRHVANKSDLVDMVLNAFVCEVDVTNHGLAEEDWMAWLRATYTNMYRVLKDLPSLYPYLSNAQRFGPHAMEVLSRVLGVLRSAGFNQEQAVNAASTLTGFTIGCAMMDTVFHEALLGVEVRPEKISTLETGMNQIITSLSVELPQNVK